MSMSDPIADFLTRIRNAQMAQMSEVSCPSSKIKVAISKVSISDRAIIFTDKTTLKTDLAITSTGAAAPSLLKSLPFEKDEGGFLLVDDQLRAKGSTCVFAVGDCSSHQKKAFPKSGVEQFLS